MLRADQSLVGALGFLVSQGQHTPCPLGKTFHTSHKYLLEEREISLFLRIRTNCVWFDSTKKPGGISYEND